VVDTSNPAPDPISTTSFDIKVDASVVPPLSAFEFDPLTADNGVLLETTHKISVSGFSTLTGQRILSLVVAEDLRHITSGTLSVLTSFDTICCSLNGGGLFA